MTIDRQNTKIAIVILHYGAVDDTIECVDSIFENFKHGQYQIVIVDNKSPDGSGSILQDKYKDHLQIHLIFNEENLGFANGNNVGYAYAKKDYGADFIVIINNDIVFTDDTFASRMLDIYEETGYGILGPDIRSLKDGAHQNPFKREKINLTTVENEIAYLETIREKVAFRKKYDFPWFYKFYYKVRANVARVLKKIFGLFGIKIGYEQLEELVGRAEDVTLHGACVIYSPRFIEVYDYGFCPKTFLYFEEAHLSYMCYRSSLKAVYDSSFSITHKEDIATNSIGMTSLAKLDFTSKHNIESARILRDEMIKDGLF